MGSASEPQRVAATLQDCCVTDTFVNMSELLKYRLGGLQGYKNRPIAISANKSLYLGAKETVDRHIVTIHVDRIYNSVPKFDYSYCL